MKWSLLELRKYQSEPLAIDTTIDLEESLIKREPQILGVSPIKVKGLLTVDAKEYLAQLEAEVTLTLPSSRSLTPVEYPMTVAFDEVYMIPDEYALVKGIEGYEHVIVLETATLNLGEAIEDYILLNIPLQVLTEEEKNGSEMPQGESWTIYSEEEYLQKQEETQQQIIDPRLAKLSALLDNNKDSDNE